MREKQQLEDRLEDLLQLPFFKRESEKTAFQEAQDLKTKHKELESKYKNKDQHIKDIETELGKLWDEVKLVTAERDKLRTMNESFKVRMTDGGAMPQMWEMMDNLMGLDPNEFRKTMHDLEFDGQEPLWSKIDFAEGTGIGWVVDEKDPASLLSEIERLKCDKRELAAELEKTQNMLKL